jgi:tetratricopeptide (TPR) repeat protein
MVEDLDAGRLMEEGKIAYQARHYAEAAEIFTQARRAFLLAGQELDAAEAANNQSVALLQAGRAAEALTAAEGSDAVFAAAQDRRRQGMACANQAAALQQLGQREEALQRYTQAVECLKMIGDKELLAYVQKQLSVLQLQTGKQLQALASMDAALENQPRLSLRERLLKKLLHVPFDMLKRH